MTYKAKVIAGGKIVILAELRREFGIKDGDSLVIDVGGEHERVHVACDRPGA